MPELELPHDHGSHRSIDYIEKELEKTESFAIVSEVFKKLSDMTRIRIFWLLCHMEECVINISALLKISSPATSHHLRTLKEGNLITFRREGKEVYYRAADTEEAQLLHKMIERVMEISCPKNTNSNNLNQSQYDIMENVHTYLTEHLSERITIEELSRKFLMNPTTLKQVFKNIYGNSIAAHIKEHRMEKAAELLRETDESILEVAQEVGYESQSKFSEAFKEHFNVLPKEYRKEKQK